MTTLGIVALILLVIAGLMVLRIKSDPMEKDSVREFLSENKNKPEIPTRRRTPETLTTPPPFSSACVTIVPPVGT